MVEVVVKKARCSIREVTFIEEKNNIHIIIEIPHFIILIHQKINSLTALNKDPS